MADADSALLAWANTFELRKPLSSLEQLGDTSAAYDIAVELIPEAMDMWKAEAQVADNLLLRESNLRKILKAVKWWYSKHREVDISAEVDAIDVSFVVRGGNLAHARQLLQILLGVAVQCDEKATFIGNIMNLEPEHQQELMIIIDRVLQSVGGMHHDDSHNTDSGSAPATPSKAALHASDDQPVRSHELMALRAELNDSIAEAKQFRLERDGLVEKVSQLEAQLDASVHMQKELQEEVLALQSQSILRSAESLQSLVYESAEYRDLLKRTYQLEADLKQNAKSMAEQTRKLEEAAKSAQEAKRMLEEMDILREKLRAAERETKQTQMLQKQVDDLLGLKDTNVSLEAENKDLTRRLSSLEAESKKIISDLRGKLARLELSQAVPGDSDASLSELESASRSAHTERLAEDLSRLNEQLNQKAEHIALLEDTIRVQNSELEEFRSHASHEDADASSLSGIPEEEWARLSPFVRAQIERLRDENQTLRESGSAHSSLLLDAGAGATQMSDGAEVEALRKAKAQTESSLAMANSLLQKARESNAKAVEKERERVTAEHRTVIENLRRQIAEMSAVASSSPTDASIPAAASFSADSGRDRPLLSQVYESLIAQFAAEFLDEQRNLKKPAPAHRYTLLRRLRARYVSSN